MTSRPWMKWFPSDWRADPLVRACEPITRYVWMEMLGLMHEAEPYGHLVLGGRAMDYKTLSRVIAVDVGEVKRAVKELEDRGVFSRTDGGVIISRRMIRDENRRKTLQENGQKGGNPSLINQGLNPSLDNQKDNQPVNPHMPESRFQRDSSLRSESKNPPIPPLGALPAAGGRREPIRSEPGPDPMAGFEEWYLAYPRKVGRGAAERAWRAKPVQQAGLQVLMDGLRRSIEHEWQGRDRDKIPHPATWLNGKRWLDGEGEPTQAVTDRPPALRPCLIERCGRLAIDDTVIRRAEPRQIMLLEAEAGLGRLSDDELRDAVALLKRGVEPDLGWLMRIRSKRAQSMTAEQG